ncbi:MAG TPA: heme exporter protein CcmD [Burkholderiales bacterium]|nr:heme exporter protein CcmD [Burkholderiales bacterium]
MSWGSLGEFLAMGGYALYVWGSYAVAAGLIVVEIAMLVARRRRALEGLGAGRAGAGSAP